MIQLPTKQCRTSARNTWGWHKQKTFNIFHFVTFFIYLLHLTPFCHLVYPSSSLTNAALLSSLFQKPSVQNNRFISPKQTNKRVFPQQSNKCKTFSQVRWISDITYHGKTIVWKLIWWWICISMKYNGAGVFKLWSAEMFREKKVLKRYKFNNYI